MDDTYEHALDRDGRDLVEAAGGGRLAAVFCRDDLVRAVLDTVDRGRNVLLVGARGVGKSAVLRGVAREMHARGRGKLVQLTTTSLLAGTRYLGEWQSKVTKMAQAAATSRSALYFSDLWNLPTAGRTSQSTTSVLDALLPFLESGDLQLVGEASPARLREMEQVPGFLERFVRIEVPALTMEAVDQVLDRAVADLQLRLDAQTQAALVQLSGRFLPKQPQPAPALGLLERVADYHAQKVEIGESEPIGPAFVEKVLSIYTGLPLFVISPRITRRASEIRTWFQERIVGQHQAIQAVVETIALYKAGLHDPGRPIGTFLFVGPTGVGKTEVARALATYLFGTPHRMLRFDLSEFKDFHAFETLVGSRTRPGEAARLVDPVRAQPFQVVLLDELEKAHPNVLDLLLPLLDEGRLTPPDGRTVDFRNTLVIATSNAGSETSKQSVGFGAVARIGAVPRHSLESAFRPEFLNRFQHVVPFHPLSAEEFRRVARQELVRILRREGITERSLVVEVDDTALDLVLVRGVDERYGARALKRELQRQIVTPLAVYLMEHELTAGQVLKVLAQDRHIAIRVLETPQSRAARRAREPVRVVGEAIGHDDLTALMPELAQALEAVAVGAEESFLREERSRLQALRQEHSFWEQGEHAARALRDLERASSVLDRLERMRTRQADLETQVHQIDTRRALEEAARAVKQHEATIERAHRELVLMGAEGTWDVLIEVAPMGPSGRLARDLLVDTYTKWAVAYRRRVTWLRVPRDDHEPAMFAVQGRYAHGFLQLEAGVHRVRDGDEHGACRVRVAPWTDRTVPVDFGEHRALKAVGAYGLKVRSRLECGHGLVLQCGLTLAESRDLAVEVAGSWADAPAPSDGIVRRYDLDQPLVRDLLTGSSSGRPDALAPQRFNKLLLARVDALEDVGPESA